MNIIIFGNKKYSTLYKILFRKGPYSPYRQGKKGKNGNKNMGLGA